MQWGAGILHSASQLHLLNECAFVESVKMQKKVNLKLDFNNLRKSFIESHNNLTEEINKIIKEVNNESIVCLDKNDLFDLLKSYEDIIWKINLLLCCSGTVDVVDLTIESNNMIQLHKIYFS